MASLTCWPIGAGSAGAQGGASVLLQVVSPMARLGFSRLTAGLGEGALQEPVISED